MTMQITFVTPLFPPDVSASATYAKTLLTRLSNTNTVTGIIYGYLPEAVTGTTLLTVDKRSRPLTRMMELFLLMWRHRHAKQYIVTNGPATELPLLLLAPFLRGRLVFVIFDTAAASRTVFARLRLAYITLFAHRLITPRITTLLPIEHHPFIPTDAAAEINYQTAWSTHLTEFFSS